MRKIFCHIMSCYDMHNTAAATVHVVVMYNGVMPLARGSSTFSIVIEDIMDK